MWAREPRFGLGLLFLAAADLIAARSCPCMSVFRKVIGTDVGTASRSAFSVWTWVERFDRRPIEPFELFTSEFGQNSVRIQENSSKIFRKFLKKVPEFWQNFNRILMSKIRMIRLLANQIFQPQVTFSTGAALSALAGYVGMWVSVRANSRVASAATRGYREALTVVI